MLEAEAEKLIDAARKNRYGLRDSTLISCSSRTDCAFRKVCGRAGINSTWTRGFSMSIGRKAPYRGTMACAGVKSGHSAGCKEKGKVADYVFASERGGRSQLAACN